MAEFDVPCLLQFEVNLLDGMAFRTFVCLESGFSVMTGAAGLSFVHHSHGHRFFCSEIKELGVACITFAVAEVLLVAESDGSRFLDFDAHIPDRMTLDAILQIESPLAVVASAAGLAFLHIRHSVTRLASEVENGVVTGFAVVFYSLLLEMLVVVKHDLTKIGYLKCNVFNVDCIGKRAYEDRDDQYKKSGPLPHDWPPKNKIRTESQMGDTVLSILKATDINKIAAGIKTFRYSK